MGTAWLVYETAVIKEGDLLWTPSPQRVANAQLTAFIQWLQTDRKLQFADYTQLWRWSVSDLDGFWQAIWDYFRVESSVPYERVLGNRQMPGADWFPGARLNFAQHVLRNATAEREALLFLNERTQLASLSWDELAGNVRILATQLRRMGVKPGDRVVAYMPNIPHTMTAMLATTSIGAIWASCSPDFGTRGVLDRLTQLAPKVLFCVDGYQYGGKPFNRKAEITKIIAGLASLEHVIYLPYLDPADTVSPTDQGVPQGVLWDELLRQPAVSAQEFKFEQVPFNHPLWILFSSGTTGLPKAIVHSHGGILIEQLKALAFHMDLHAGDRMFFNTTTGWMMWNFLASSMLAGAVPVLYDGNPAYPDQYRIWRLVQDAKINFCGSSPTYVETMAKAGIVPKDKFDLSSLRTVMPAGSPVTAECAAWFYENLKKDLWLATGSGGTDFCTGYVGGVVTQPVYAGEIQAPSLGVASHAFNERGESVVDEVGELVITEPMPSMPVYFWNDADNERYLESYFQEFAGLWRHGDFFRINARGGCFVLGRSDSTLNRFGIRIGTAEVYRVLATIDELLDSLILNLDLPGGRFFMPLFVKLRPGLQLNAEIEAKINASLRREYSPRHVPDKIYQVEDIPVTLSGKKLEVPVRKILMGVAPDKAANQHTMPNPQSLEYFIEYQRTQKDYKL
jgi:acetoacetyl-CoA synthetase